MIEWSPVDVLTCLETEPAVDEDEDCPSHRYTLSRGGVVVELEIWPYHYDVSLTIRSVDQTDPLVELRMKGCSEIHYIRDGTREALHFVSFDAGSEHRVNFVRRVVPAGEPAGRGEGRRMGCGDAHVTSRFGEVCSLSGGLVRTMQSSLGLRHHNPVARPRVCGASGDAAYRSAAWAARSAHNQNEILSLRSGAGRGRITSAHETW